MPLERNLYNLAIRQIKDQVTAPADLDGLYQLVPLLISVDGGWITALLQHLLKGRFTELFVAVYVVRMITRYTKELPTERKEPMNKIITIGREFGSLFR